MQTSKQDTSVVVKETVDDILPEYDFSHARPNKYAAAFAKGSIVVTLDPDVAAVFPDAAKANEALRVLAGLIRTYQATQPENKGRNISTKDSRKVLPP